MKWLALLLLLFLPLVAQADAPSVSLPRCTQAQHDSYTARGPDGAAYPTWHPQIDGYYGCYEDHEHGSNPRTFGAPLYGYSAASMGMAEGNAGFKSYLFQRGGTTWLITQHQGTARADLAACVRMHTLDIAARDGSGVLVADLHLMGDFGRSVSNRSGLSFTPPSCPNQGNAAPSTGIRQLPAMDNDNVGYEPWRVDSRPLPFLSFGDLTFNTPNAQTACDTISCTAAIRRTDIGGSIPANGAYRFLTINGGFRLHATGSYSGTFQWQGATQFIAPYLDVRLIGGVCRPVNALAYLYTCTAYPDEMEFRLNPFVTGAN